VSFVPASGPNDRTNRSQALTRLMDEV
jgi:hypothetical protein